MGFRFRKSFKIAPGIRMNVGKRGISTTVGGKGASVNIGPRGTYANVGIPGSGISYREKIGGRGRSPGQGGAGNDASTAGCMGCGCAGLFGIVVLFGIIGSFGSDSTPAPEPYRPNSLYAADTAATVGADAEDFYLHSAMNVRSGPGEEHPVLWTVERGGTVKLGPKDPDGWAPVYLTGNTSTPNGYLYRASDQVRSYPPSARRSSSASSSASSSSGNASSAPRRSSAEERGYYRGPRGGCYTYSASGRKRYVDRSMCD